MVILKIMVTIKPLCPGCGTPLLKAVNRPWSSEGWSLTRCSSLQDRSGSENTSLLERKPLQWSPRPLPSGGDGSEVGQS